MKVGPHQALCRLCGRPTPVEYRREKELKKKIVTCINCELRFAEKTVGPLLGQELVEGEDIVAHRLRMRREAKRRKNEEH